MLAVEPLPHIFVQQVPITAQEPEAVLHMKFARHIYAVGIEPQTFLS